MSTRVEQVKSLAKLKVGRSHYAKGTGSLTITWIALTDYQEVEQEGKDHLVITPSFPNL